MRSMKILIIDSRNETAKQIKKILEGGGCEVEMVAEGSQGEIEFGDYDFFVTDARLDEILRSGTLELNVVEHTVRQKKRLVKLTPTEFRILEYFMRHRGRVIVKRDLIEKCWIRDGQATTNAVEVYIKKLRGKLGNNIVRTVHGVGYVMGKKPSK